MRGRRVDLYQSKDYNENNCLKSCIATLPPFPEQNGNVFASSDTTINKHYINDTKHNMHTFIHI